MTTSSGASALSSATRSSISGCAAVWVFLTIMLSEDSEEALYDGISLNDLEVWSTEERSAVRLQLSRIFRSDANSYTRARLSECLTPLSRVNIELPFEIGDYTDFYCSIFHATNVGSMFRPDNPSAAELQIPAHRLPRPGFVDRHVGHGH